MIIGSGLLAKAFAPRFSSSPNIWIYAAGVSNSACTDTAEFERERLRLSDAVRAGAQADAFLYFGTCSVADPASCNSRYVQHKLEMERLVRAHPNFIVARLPQVAGRTPNPHTLLNYLYARVCRSERITVWKNATRNVIDVDDVVSLVAQVVAYPRARRVTINVANPRSSHITEIVSAMEKVTGKRAIKEEIEDGAAYRIDTTDIEPIISRLRLSFDSTYVLRVIQKYYGDSGAK